jgi:hypothetical protein
MSFGDCGYDGEGDVDMSDEVEVSFTFLQRCYRGDMELMFLHSSREATRDLSSNM